MNPRPWTRGLWCVVAGAVAVGALAARGAEPATVAAAAPAGEHAALLADGVPCPIYVEDATAAHGKALAECLKKLSGKDFKVETLRQDAAPPAGPAVVIRVTDAKAPRLGGDGFTIKTEAGQLRITGETPLAAGFGVFAFLEQELGCTWWSHDEEEVPTNTSLEVRALNLTVKAPFRQTIVGGEANIGTNNFTLKSRAVSTERFTGGHNAYALLADYAATHPEIFPMDKTGQRKGNNIHFCYLAPGIVDAVCEGLEKQIVEKKGNVRDHIYFFGMGDGHGVCQCPDCRKVYEEEAWTDPYGNKYPGNTATQLRMMNAVGEKLEKKYPGVRVGFFAYLDLSKPPAKTVARSNVVVYMTHIEWCLTHPASECDNNKTFRAIVERWCEVAPGRVYMWDYAANFHAAMWPWPNVRAIAANIRYYAKIGIAGVFLQSSSLKGGDLGVLKNYVWRRVMWNPALDTDALIREFCTGYYGPAAADMLRYVTRLEDAAAKGPDMFFLTYEKGARGLQTSLLTPEMEADLKGILAAAVKAAGGKDPYDRRVREAANSLAAWDLRADLDPAKNDSVLAPKDGYLARDGKVTWPKVRDFFKYSRDASIREFANPVFYKTGALIAHGGPLPTLRKGEVEVDVAPAQAGRIYQIRFQGKPLLRAQYHCSAKRDYLKHLDHFPTVFRGSFERLTNNWTDKRFACLPPYLEEVDRKDDAITMRGCTSIGQWVISDLRTEKTVEVLDGGIVRVTGNDRNSIWKERKVAGQATSLTDYAIPSGAAFTVETSSDGAAWKTIELVASSDAAPANELLPDGVPATRPLTRASLAAPGNTFRIRLPQGVVVEDAYRSPAVEKAVFTYDATQGVLTSEISTATVTNDDWVVREIKLATTGK